MYVRLVFQGSGDVKWETGRKMKHTGGVLGIILALSWGMHVVAAPVCPLIPMGAITGKPDEQTVQETLEAYKAVGVEQYLIYPRSGLELTYMGDEWLQMCEWFCKHAKRLGMKIWLYDEYNWPSGSCKGRVPAENPAFESRQFAVNKQPDGAYSWQVVHAPGWADNYSLPAMRRFIELTHKRYEQRLASYLGGTVVGIFTDEPAHPTPVSLARKPDLLFRYFDGAEEEYRAATGRGLREDVQAYLSDPSKDAMWADYYGLLGRRFRKAHFDPITAWCRRVGIESTGHMIAENSTESSALYNGDPLHALKGLTVPGMDEIGTRLEPGKIEWITFAVAQHAAGRCGKGGLAELFALGPSDLSLATHRQMLWLCAAHKIDRYVLAIAPLDARGNVEKSGYFNPMSPMQPWFPAFRHLADESCRAARYAAKPQVCEVAVRYPQREAARLAASRKPHPALLATLRALTASQITYDLYEEDEACDKRVVLAFEGAAIRDEKSGRRFTSFEEAVAFAGAQCPPAARVETVGGRPVSAVVTRAYRDGSVLVLGLGGEPHGSLRLVRAGRPSVSFALPARGVRVWEGDRNEPAPADNRRTVPVTADGFALTLSAPVVQRLVFNAQGQARFSVAQPVEGVRLVVRHHPQPSAVTLDGVPVSAGEACRVLRLGIDALYRQSAPFRLEAGEHRVVITAGGSDTNFFLPVACLTGPFAVNDGKLSALPVKVAPGALWRQGLAGFCGSVSFRTQVAVPQLESGSALRLDTGGLYASVALGGRELGTRAWAPFEWEVPAGLKGKTVELAVTLRTSVAPLFGDGKHPEAAWPKKFWVPPPDPKPGVGLLAMPEWVFAGE